MQTPPNTEVCLQRLAEGRGALERLFSKISNLVENR